MVDKIKEVLQMHCLLRPDGWDCDVMNPDRCAECLARHLVNHGISFRPAVPGCDDKYNIAEMAFRNGEIRMKERMVDMILGMQAKVNGSQHAQLREILEGVKKL